MKPKEPTISERCERAKRAAKRGVQSGNWKGGRVKDKHGYIHLWKPGHPNANIGHGRQYILEHRFIMSEYLGRPLSKHETVHHKNGIKDDNRIKNLELMTKRVHRGRVECPHCGKRFTIR
jgi:hypothetical protein